MPDFLPPRHGVSFSRALARAAAVAPLVPVLSTYELYHPLGTPDGPIYVVNNLVAINAFKEVGASRDAGVQVTYLASKLTIGRPEESDTAASPEIAITVSNVSGLMNQALKAARGSLVQWELIERFYSADDLSAPDNDPPLVVFLSSADVDGETVTIRASFGDPANVRIPALTFSRTQYPTLVR